MHALVISARSNHCDCRRNKTVVGAATWNEITELVSEPTFNLHFRSRCKLSDVTDKRIHPCGCIWTKLSEDHAVLHAYLAKVRIWPTPPTIRKVTLSDQPSVLRHVLSTVQLFQSTLQKMARAVNHLLKIADMISVADAFLRAIRLRKL